LTIGSSSWQARLIRGPGSADGIGYPRATVATVSPEEHMSLVATGRFLTIIPISAARFPVRRLDLKGLPVQLLMMPNGIVTLKNRTLSPVAALFIEDARDVARSLGKGR
jgi:DNA-binding transcriptional LysR family regulator